MHNNKIHVDMKHVVHIHLGVYEHVNNREHWCVSGMYPLCNVQCIYCETHTHYAYTVDMS